MLTVGASSTWALFILASCASACPTRSTKSVFHVEASEISAGKQVAFTPWVKPPAPRDPFGPSVIFKEGIPSRSLGTVYHMFVPASIDTFSCRVIWLSTFSILSCIDLFLSLWGGCLYSTPGGYAEYP